MTTWLAVVVGLALGGVFGALVAFVILTGRSSINEGRHTLTTVTTLTTNKRGTTMSDNTPEPTTEAPVATEDELATKRTTTEETTETHATEPDTSVVAGRENDDAGEDTAELAADEEAGEDDDRSDR